MILKWFDLRVPFILTHRNDLHQLSAMTQFKTPAPLWDRQRSQLTNGFHITLRYDRPVVEEFIPGLKGT